MPSQKIVVVFGATGVQGGSVIKSILGDSRTAEEFKLRGITRDPSKPNAQALIKQGVECVEGDVNSKESLEKALKGAYAVFAVTNYWEKMDPELEKRQGKLIADVSVAAGVQHLIWSSLYNVTELTDGKFSGVEHFDSKADVEKYIRTLSIPATFFMPGFYMSNVSGGMLHPNADSSKHEYVLTLPVPDHTPIPLFDAGDDTGKFVKAILTHRDEVLGKRVLAATDYYTCKQIVDEFREVKKEDGKDSHFERVSEQAFKDALGGMPDRGKDEMYENMAFMTDYGYYGKAGLGESHAILDEKPTTWKEFVAKAKPWADLK
ncbi:hypothetical protein MMC07_007021 [Pseudocyphellaria aurata]|nr:hypothetical protein [Pseudocyphellaria aurata]